MAAAEMSVSMVQKENEVWTGVTGTPMRIRKYIFQVTKVTDADWIVTADAFGESDAPILYNAVTIDSSSNGVFEGTVGVAYTHSGTVLTFSGGTTGVLTGTIYYAD
jgi:hypothetical protein